MSAKSAEGLAGKVRKMENGRARGRSGGFHQHFGPVAKGKLKTETAIEALSAHTHPVQKHGDRKSGE